MCRKQWTYQIYSLGFLFRCIITPGLTPEPLLRKWLDWHLVDHVVGQILREGNKQSNHTDKACSVWELIEENSLRTNAPPGPGWTGCWGLDSDPGTGLSVCLQLRSSWTSSDPPHIEHWGEHTHTHKSSHICLYSALYNIDCLTATSKK